MNPPESAALPGAPRHRIALVDDEAQILSALRRELRHPSLDLVTFEDSRVAADELAKEEFALILSDNMMPSLTGLELLARIKQTQPRTRRILLTGRTDLNQAVEAFNAGAIHCFMNKPWNKAQLLEAVWKELGIYDGEKNAHAANAQLAAQHRARTAKLVTTMNELKQTQTQLVLLEDSGHLGVLHVSPALRNVSLLLVEEHEAVRNLLEGALKGVGIARCHGVPNGNAALDHLRSAPPVDVILSEWTLDGMDGLTFLRKVREGGTPSEKATFILLGNHEQRAMVEFALKSGVDGYLIKPFRLQNLLNQIENLRVRNDLDGLEDLKPLRRATILVANSHPSSRGQIESMLGQIGVPTVFGATFGPAAVAAIEKRKPDVVIYDINVKDPTWEQLRAQFQKELRPPALLVTGVLSSEEDRKAISQAGLSVFLEGPFTQVQLARSLLSAWSPAPAVASTSGTDTSRVP